jgi:hypothetical protein
VKLEDAAEIVEQHLVNRRPVERLRIAATCISSKVCPIAEARFDDRGARSTRILFLILKGTFRFYIPSVVRKPITLFGPRLISERLASGPPAIWRFRAL